MKCKHECKSSNCIDFLPCNILRPFFCYLRLPWNRPAGFHNSLKLCKGDWSIWNIISMTFFNLFSLDLIYLHLLKRLDTNKSVTDSSAQLMMLNFIEIRFIRLLLCLASLLRPGAFLFWLKINLFVYFALVNCLVQKWFTYKSFHKLLALELYHCKSRLLLWHERDAELEDSIALSRQDYLTIYENKSPQCCNKTRDSLPCKLSTFTYVKSSTWYFHKISYTFETFVVFTIYGHP